MWFIIVAVIIIFLSNKFFLRVESQFGWNEYRNQVRKLDILIIWIFLNLRRRKCSTFLLIGLGVADLLVGGLAIPLFIAAFESASITAWRVFNLVDVFTSTSSIYALAVISVERMFAIGWPPRHRTANFRVYICAISIPWIIATVFTFFHWCKLQLHYKWQRNLPSSFASCNTSISYVCSVLCYLEASIPDF